MLTASDGSTLDDQALIAWFTSVRRYGICSKRVCVIDLKVGCLAVGASGCLEKMYLDLISYFNFQ